MSAAAPIAGGGDALRTFILAGNATFTVVSRATGARYTYKVQGIVEEPTKFFVKVLNGPDNEADYGHLCMMDRSHQGLRAYGVKCASKKAKAGFEWLLRQLNRGADFSGQAEVYHEGRCGRCGRKLTVPESIESGFGPECIGKV